MTETASLNRKRLILSAFIVLVLLYLIIFSARSGLSYISQYRLHATIDGWQKGEGDQPSLTGWQEMESMAVEALGSDSTNPDLHNALGRLYDYRGIAMSGPDQQRIEYAKKATVQYRQVIRLRPTWPYGYFNLMNSKAGIGALDAEFRQTLLRLIELAPWEENTLPGIVQVSTYAWPYLDIKSRIPIKEYLLLAAEKRMADVRKALRKKKLTVIFCAVIAHGEKPIKLCP